MISILIGGAVAAGTYWYAKKQKQASTGQSALAAGATGVAGFGATALTIWAVAAAWPVLLIGGAVAGGYYIGKKRDQKALPPAES